MKKYVLLLCLFGLLGYSGSLLAETTGITYNSDGTATIQSYLGDESSIELYFGENEPFTILNARITLDVFNDVQTGFADIRCTSMPAFPFGSYYAILLDRRGAVKPDLVQSEMVVTETRSYS